MDAEPVAAVADDAVVVEVEPPNPIHDVLVACGITKAAHRATLIEFEGLDSIAAFTSMGGDGDITEMAKRMASRPSVAAGRVILGTMQIKKLQALVYWVKDYDRRGMQAAPELWTVVEMNKAMERKESEYSYGKIDVDIIDPGKCQTDFGWDNWQIAFVNKLNATMGAAKVPVDYIVRPEWDSDDELFLEDDELRRYQMPLTGKNFKRDNKLVYQMLKSACIKSDAWTWIQSYDRASDGRKAWLALVAHYDGTGELNKRVERAKEELARLHYKDEKIFPFKKYVTKLKENFFVLEKDKHEELTGKQQVDILLRGIRSTDAGITSAKINVYQSFRSDFNKAAEFLSGLIANMHASVQLDYANRQQSGNKRRYVSALGANDQRRGRGRARQGGGRSGQRTGRGGGQGRGGRGRSNERCTYANNVDITDPHRNFTSDEWERLGSMRSYVLQLREGGRGGRGRGDRNQNDVNANRTTSSVATNNYNNGNSNDSSNGNNISANNSVVSEITERGSQNGRSFGRGAYNNT
jgi:hypothetical protein